MISAIFRITRLTEMMTTMTEEHDDGLDIDQRLAQ
jgi:hypothetical protein